MYNCLFSRFREKSDFASEKCKHPDSSHNMMPMAVICDAIAKAKKQKNSAKQLFKIQLFKLLLELLKPPCLCHLADEWQSQSWLIWMVVSSVNANDCNVEGKLCFLKYICEFWRRNSLFFKVRKQFYNFKKIFWTESVLLELPTLILNLNFRQSVKLQKLLNYLNFQLFWILCF